MQLYFIRHAQSINNALWQENGHNNGRKADPLITEIGKQQAERVGAFLAESGLDFEQGWGGPKNVCGFGITHLYCSLMERAVQTGTIIADQLGLGLIAKVDLHETGGIFLKEVINGQEGYYGLPGHNRQYFENRYPRLILPKELDESGWWKQDLEPREAYLPRAKHVLDDLMKSHAGTEDRVGVIIHGGIFKYIFEILFNFNAEKEFTVFVNNCSITRIDLIEDKTLLMYLNRIDFLPPELIT